MSKHVIPSGERPHHVTTMDCRCKPVVQSAIDGDRIVWVVAHHELRIPACEADSTEGR